jgi:hypothetical protein
MFQTKVVGKIKTHILRPIRVFENRAVYEIMWKKYGRDGQATNDNVVRNMRFAWWINKATGMGTHTWTIRYLLLFQDSVYANACQRYVYAYSTIPAFVIS